MENQSLANAKRREELNKRREENPDKYKVGKLYATSTADLKSPQEVINRALSAQYKHMPDSTRNQLARIIVVQPEGKTLKMGDKDVSIGDLSVAIADSIEIINSGTSSKEEYHDWIQSGQAIISDMKTNGVTQEELDTRNFFLNDLDQREAELMTCLGLYYRMVSDPKIKAKYDELYTKLQKLREIRSAVKNSTQNVADDFEKEARERALREAEAVKVFPSVEDAHLMVATIGALSIYDSLTKEDKQGLDMYHGDDFTNMNFYDHLKDYYLYNNDFTFVNRSGEPEHHYEVAPMERKISGASNKSNIATRLAALRGIQNDKNVAVKPVDTGKNYGAFTKNKFSIAELNDKKLGYNR